MPLAVDALQPSIVGELIAATRGESMTLADLITAKRIGYNLTFMKATKAVVLDFGESSKVTSALASDCGRFSSAAFQTAAAVGDEMEDRDGFPWSLVKTYYAGFYAAHAIMRTFGEGCSFFYRQHTDQISRMAQALSLTPGFAVDAGLYHCTLSADSTVATYVKASGQSGGTHEAFWFAFGSKLKSLSEDVLKGALPRRDAQAVFTKLDELLQVLARKAGYSWLSNVRNDLQYRLQHKAWYPERVRSQSREGLCRLAKQWVRDPLTIDIHGRWDLLGDFVGACTFLVALCREILARIGGRSTQGRHSFARSGPLAFLDDIGVKSLAS